MKVRQNTSKVIVLEVKFGLNVNRSRGKCLILGMLMLSLLETLDTQLEEQGKGSITVRLDRLERGTFLRYTS